MRVLFVFDHYASGGFETHLDTFLAALAARGMELFCISGPDFSRSPARSCVRRHIEVDLRRLTGSEMRRATVRVSEVIEREKIDAVFIHPFYWFIPAATASLIAGTPYAVMFHGPSTPEAVDYFYPEAMRHALARFVLPGAPGVVTVSEACSRAIAARLGSRARTHVVRNPINLRQFDAPAQKQPAPAALFVSRLDDDKQAGTLGALEFLARWKQRRPEWKLRVAGSGACADSLRDRCAWRGLPIEWLGRRQDIDRLIAESGLVIGMGRVILESLASRRLTVLSGCEGMVGLVDTRNFAALQQRNFSGRESPIRPAAEAVRGVERALGSCKHPYEVLRSMVARDHDVSAVAGQLEAILAGLKPRPAAKAKRVLQWMERLGDADLLSSGWKPESRGLLERLSVLLSRD
jgi:glycosyltransferase involved in cell wall biosynthesis